MTMQGGVQRLDQSVDSDNVRVPQAGGQPAPREYAERLDARAFGGAARR
jgi:hypothetical protein